MSTSKFIDSLLGRIAQGDQDAREQLFAKYLAIIRNLVHLRIDDRIAPRISPSDIVQETMIEVSKRLEEYLRKRPMSFDAWVRKTAYQNLARVVRTHLRTERRNAGREIAFSIAGSLIIVERLGLEYTESPSDHLERTELVEHVQEIMQALSDEDRELILMRTCEGLDNATAASILGIDPRLCSKRYSRALLKLRAGFREQTGGLEP